jgi:hypothetical protein
MARTYSYIGIKLPTCTLTVAELSQTTSLPYEAACVYADGDGAAAHRMMVGATAVDQRAFEYECAVVKAKWAWVEAYTRGTTTAGTNASAAYCNTARAQREDGCQYENASLARQEDDEAAY